MSGPRRWAEVLWRHPARAVTVGFAVTIAIGTVLLMTPPATSDGHGAPPLEALFTSTSAVCVTGLIVVDTATYWSGWGQAVIAGLIQVGGFGIMTMAAVIAVLLSREVGVRSRLLTQRERATLEPADLRAILVGVATVTLVVESVVAAVLVAGFAGELGWARAVPEAAFTAVSAFNNAGFALQTDSLGRWVTDPVVSGAVAAAVVIGGIGFPVIDDLRRHGARWRDLRLHSRLTLTVTAVLLAVGALLFWGFEWSNPATLGGLGVPGKLLAGAFQAVMPRTAGFSTIDFGAIDPPTELGTIVLMFIGGGAASTAGGVKVTTVAVLSMVVWAEIRGDPDVNVFGRRIPERAQREALAIVMVAVGAVIAASLVLTGLSHVPIGDALFEATSAFGTVGLSTGITPELGHASQLVLVALMFAGRLGPLTVGAALVLRAHDLRFRLPEEAPIIG